MSSSPSLERRSWFWAMDKLHQKRPGVPGTVSRLVLPVADTVLYRDNEPWAWIFTSKDGEVLRRHSKRCRTELVVEGVMKRSLEDAAAAGSRLPHAAVIRRGTSTSNDIKASLVTEEDLTAMVGDGGGLTSNLLALQACVHARAGSGTRFRCDANREVDGLVMRFTVQKLCYLGAPTTFDAPHPRSVAGAKLGIGPAFALKSTMKSFNDQLSAHCATLVSHLEAVGRTKVVHLQVGPRACDIHMHIHMHCTHARMPRGTCARARARRRGGAPWPGEHRLTWMIAPLPPQADFVLDAATDSPLLISIPLVHTVPLPKPAPLVSSASLSSLGASESAVAGALLAASSQPTLSPGRSPAASPSKASPVKSPHGAERGAGGALISSITGAAGKASKERASKGGVKQCGNAMNNEPGPRAPKLGFSGTTDVLAKPASAIHDEPLLPQPNRPASGGGLRPPPWLRLHPPIPKGFAHEGPMSMADLKAKKVLVCSGDFCSVAAVAEPDVDEPAPNSRRYQAGNGSAGKAWKPPPDVVSGGGSRVPGFMVPYRSILLARAEHAMPKVKTNDARGAALRASLLEQGRPGRAHPQAAVQPHPHEFYSPVMVCHACYVVYCRLDKARANTGPEDLDETPPVRPPSSALRGMARSATEGALKVEGADEWGHSWVDDARERLSMARKRASSASTLSGGQRRQPLQLATLEYAALNAAEALGSRETKRLVKELMRHRRPATAGEHNLPRAALHDAPSSVVSAALAGGMWESCGMSCGSCSDAGGFAASAEGYDEGGYRLSYEEMREADDAVARSTGAIHQVRRQGARPIQPVASAAWVGASACAREPGWERVLE